MKYDERLIGPKPSDAILAESKKRLDAMFKKRFEDLQARRRIEAASFGVIRDLAKKDPKLTAAVEEGKKYATARSKIRAKPPQRTKVEGRQHIGSVAVKLVRSKISPDLRTTRKPELDAKGFAGVGSSQNTLEWRPGSQLRQSELSPP